jgi:hypothetical protein
LHHSLYYRHRLCCLGRKDQGREPNGEFSKCVFRKLYGYSIWIYNGLVSRHLFLWWLQ